MKRVECHAGVIRTYDDKGEDVFSVSMDIENNRIVIHPTDAAKLAYELHSADVHIRGLLRPKTRFGKLRARLSDWIRPY